MQTAIDFVFLWCDGSDPDFVRQKAQRMKAVRPELITENIGDIRYVQFDELKYALRSVNQFAPWFHHIFVVTNNQRPKWLIDHPKISVVDHKEIIPKDLQPVFSSICIEMYLDRIPGLSEHFVYSNDDMMLSRPLIPDDFFDAQGKPIVWMSNAGADKMTSTQANLILNDDSINSWQKTLIRAWELYRRKTGRRIPFFTPAHAMDAYNISMFREVLFRFPELLQTNSSPFRTGGEISRVLFSYVMANELGCQCLFRQNTRFFNRMKTRFFRAVEVLAVVRDHFAELKRDVELFKPKAFCINNLRQDEAPEMIRYLNDKFPQPAPWECGEN